MIIDFKEIPPANLANGEQDRFEQFACDFLETIGYKIIRRPDRGADSKKDLIVSDTRTGVSGETIIKWLVSCKHKAHSGTSIKDTDEPDIYDRVIEHNCQGFLGFYSTILAPTLSNKLFGLRSKIEETTFDSTRIERELLRNNQRERLLASYFPISHDKHRQNLFSNSSPTDNKSDVETLLTEEDVLRITKTAIILLDIGKIEEKYYNEKLDRKKYILDKLYRFIDHSNEKVANAIFIFLESIAHLATQKKPFDIASSVHSLIFTFFPSSYRKEEEEERIENGKQCAYIGFNLAYDAFIYLNNFGVAEYGLSILKLIYQKGKQNEMPELSEIVLKQYDDLEKHLDRPERNDLENAKEFLKVFKADLETKDLSFPVLPNHLLILTLNRDEK